MIYANTDEYKTNYTLRRRAALAQTAIITAIVLCFSIAIIVFNTYRLNAQLEDQIANISRLAETNLASSVWQVDYASARDFIDAILHNKTVVFAQVVTGREIMASKSRPEYAGQPFTFFKTDSHFLTKTVEIKKFGDWIGTFNIAISTAQINQEILIHIGATLALALILILAITQTTFYFARKRIFNPLKNLEASATAIADGNLDASIDTSAPDELGNLARAFDDMRESVRHLISDLQEANAKLQNHRSVLETTVKERTEELNQKNISLNQALEEVSNSEQTAEIANLAKSQFLASMSHEIRTPMNAILGMADILWETKLTKDQKQYVQVFRTAGESLLEILNDILDLSKIEAGHLELEKTVFSLGELIDKTCTVVEPKAEQKKLSFEYSMKQNVPTRLTGDPTRLRQVIINLLDNAVKFTAKGSVHLIIERAPSHDGGVTLQFSISDTGPGIPATKLASIFDSFTQADSSTTRKYGGTGLGLAISKQLVQLMRGHIWAESSSGKGSTFHFTAEFDIPQPEKIQSTEEPAHLPQAELPKANILMLEDSKYNAFVIQTYLKGTPCHLTVKENGVEGLEAFKKGKWDIVFMDIQLPVMDGYEATRAIRKWEKKHNMPPLPIVAMTAHALVGDAEKCFEAGANMHLPKPVKRISLFDAIRNLLGADQQPQKAQTTPETNTDHTLFAAVKKSISVAHTALAREDYNHIKTLSDDLIDEGVRLSMDAIARYGKSLKEAASGETDPAQVKQVLTILTEYIDHFKTVQ